jgi:membrane protein DedA with SNARE-associated domain
MIIPLAIGTSGVSRTIFFFLNLLGAIVWAFVFLSLGYFFGEAIEQSLGQVKRAGQFILIGVIVGVALMQLIQFLRLGVNAKIEKVERNLSNEPGSKKSANVKKEPKEV